MVTDTEGLTYDKSFEFSVYDRPENTSTSITLDNPVYENIYGGNIANIDAVGSDVDGLAYSVLPDYDGEMLEVQNSVLKFKEGIAADFEQDQLLHFFLRATHPEGTYIDQEFHIFVLEDIFDNPQHDTIFKQIGVDIQANVLSDGDLDSLEGTMYGQLTSNNTAHLSIIEWDNLNGYSKSWYQYNVETNQSSLIDSSSDAIQINRWSNYHDTSLDGRYLLYSAKNEGGDPTHLLRKDLTSGQTEDVFNLENLNTIPTKAVIHNDKAYLSDDGQIAVFSLYDGERSGPLIEETYQKIS